MSYTPGATRRERCASRSRRRAFGMPEAYRKSLRGPDLRAAESVELAPEIRRDRLHAELARLGLRRGVVVGVGVHVVRVRLALRVGDELDAGDADAVVGDEAAILLDERALEALDDAEARGGRCLLAYGAERVAHLARVGRTELEAERGIHAHGVE